MEGEASRSAALGHVTRWPPFFKNGHLGLGILKKVILMPGSYRSAKKGLFDR